MDDQKKILLLLGLLCGIVLFASRAHAEPHSPQTEPHAAVAQFANDPRATHTSDPDKSIRAAVRVLEQAALQRDFASNQQELAFLQSAHDQLAAAMQALCCLQRERTAQLISDIKHVIVRDSTYLGAAVSAEGDDFGPPGPTQNQLKQLVTEGQDLVRNAPLVHRLRDADAFDLASAPVATAPLRINAYPLRLQNTDALSMPTDTSAASPQLHFNF